MTKEEEIMEFLHQRVFDPVLQSSNASEKLKIGIRYTIMRLNEHEAQGMVSYFWSAIIGTDRSVKFAKEMKENGFIRFEEVIDDFRSKFTDTWLSS